MKSNWWVLVLLGALLGNGCERQSESSVATIETITNREGKVATETPVGFVPDSDSNGTINEWGIAVNEPIEETRTKAEKGNAAAQIRLGICYLAGQGVPQNYSEAMEWLGKGAEQGTGMPETTLVQCYSTLGHFHYFGLGMPTNYSTAVKWYRRAGDLGVAEAQLRLGGCYANGQGVAQDESIAFEWFRKAADQGMPEAEVRLGLCYHQGQGIAPDKAEAVKWFRKSAEQGNPYGQSILGASYAEGAGVPRNDIEAYKWLSLGAACEVVDEVQKACRNILRSLETSMSRDEIVEAQRLSATFVPRRNKQSTEKRTGLGLLADLQRPKASGTGFFISTDGFLISNHHVVEGASQVRLVTSAGLISAKVVKVDAANDLALLKAEGRFAALPVAASRAVKLGGTVATVGFPNIGLQGFAPKLAKGEIASLSGAGDDARYFQISVPVQPGNSGGALVDERGNVVGVVSAKLNAGAALRSSGALPENVNYAVKSSYLLSFLESVPDVANKLKEASAKEKKFEDVVKEAEQAAVLVLVY